MNVQIHPSIQSERLLTVGLQNLVSLLEILLKRGHSCYTSEESTTNNSDVSTTSPSAGTP